MDTKFNVHLRKINKLNSIASASLCDTIQRKNEINNLFE